jgi:hypothetical protein
MLGEVGHDLDEGPYILEPLIEEWDELTHTVRLELMACTLKMFFRRPPECQKMLGKLLAKATADPSNVDVHDKAMFYYRLLEYDIDEAQRVVVGNKETIETFVEDTETEVKDQIFEEFNSLSVIYQKPAHKFVTAKDIQDGGTILDVEESSDEEDEENQAASSGNSDEEDEESSSESESEDEDEEVLVFLAMHSFGKSVPQVFEKNWMSAKDSETVSLSLSAGTNDGTIDRNLSQCGLHSMATGSSGGNIRAYYIGERQDKAGVFMAEVIINLGARSLSATLKTNDAAALGSFKKHFLRALSTI